MEWMFMPLRRYAEFGGRSRRQEFWMFALLQFILYMILFTLTLVVGVGAAGFASFGNVDTAAPGMIGMIAALGIFALVYVLIYLGLLIPNLAVSTRRLHDTGRSGWWVMLYWGPWLLGLLVSFAAIGVQSEALVGLRLIPSLLQLIGIVVLIVFWCLPGTVGPNEYGPDPMGGASNLAETFG